MADLSEDIEVKVASNGRTIPHFRYTKLTFSAASEFVDTYYQALNFPTRRIQISSFYVKPANGTTKTSITLNGNIVEDGTAVQKIFEKEIGKTIYEVHSYDCNALNPNYNVDRSESALAPAKDGSKMSVLLMVSGNVRYWKKGENEEPESRNFSETFVLVPNWDAQGPKAPKGLKRWLIQSQNFRVVS